MDDLLPLLISASTVIVYRASPEQKAQIVSLIRKEAPSKKTCAIGDGANDINMI